MADRLKFEFVLPDSMKHQATKSKQTKHVNNQKVPNKAWWKLRKKFKGFCRSTKRASMSLRMSSNQSKKGMNHTSKTSSRCPSLRLQTKDHCRFRMKNYLCQ